MRSAPSRADRSQVTSRALWAFALNTLGFEMFADPTVGARWRDLFWCGPKDAGVEQLITDVGLRPVRVGDIDAIDVDGVGRHA